MTQTKLSYKIGAWFFIFLMFVQSTFAYGIPVSGTHEAEPAQQEETENNSVADYSTDNTEGVIGIYDGNNLDNPADNYFQLWLDEMPLEDEQIYLVYELEGVANYHSVSRSINDELAIGGHWVEVSYEQSTQRELLNPKSLRQGENSIHFGILENADYGYKVSNLRFEREAKKGENKAIHYTALSQDGKVYLKGFVNEKVTDLQIADQEINLHNGNFEVELPLAQAQAFTLIKEDGSKEIEKITSKDLAWLDFRHAIEDFGATKTALFQKESDNELQLESIELLAEKEQVLEDKELSVTSLRAIDLPALDMGMSNLTKTNKAYRFLPHGEHFGDSGAVVKIAYDKLSLPSGFTEKDINAYYFNTQTGHWASLQKDSVDTQNGIIYARTTHFTDMIAGVIKAPESPETAGFTPTMMTGIKAADPTTKVGLIAPPQANQRGSAGMQYPFEMPPARNGMTPNVALSYNSDGGSGWLGEGWDISTPSISVETRWGVPRYNTTKETETYLMDGSMLGFMDNGELYLSHRHKEKKARATDRQFYPRKEGSFSKIIRKGSSPSNYTWEVTDKGGTVYTYGGNGGVLKGTITDINGNQREVITEWKLSRVEEKHGDYIEYYYESKTEEVRGSLTAKALYLTKIENSSGTTVVFDSQTKKTKKTNNARYGFLTSSHQLLDKISILFEETTLRYYTFNYKDGAFHTNLLDKVSQYDSNEEEFASHQFDYYNDVSGGGSLVPFKDSEDWNLHRDGLSANFINPISNVVDFGQFADKPTALGGSKSTSAGGSIYIGIGPTGDPTSTMNTGGGSFSYNYSESKGISTLMDINGDAIPDKVFVQNGSMYYRQGKSNGEFSSPIKIKGITQFSSSTTNTRSGGAKANVSNIMAGVDKQVSDTKTKIYFTDVNGDGLVDLVNGGTVYFNHIEKDELGNLVPTFTTNSQNTPAPIVGGGTVDDSDTEIDPAEQEEAIANSPLQDAVRVWIAPFDGIVKVLGSVQKKAPSGEYNLEEYNKADGVRVAIQKGGSELWSKQIAKDNFNVFLAEVQSVNVKKGEKIYFRVQSGTTEIANGSFDQVLWSPSVSYTDRNIEDPNGYTQTYSSVEGTLCGGSGTLVPICNTYSVSGKFVKPITSDDITLRVQLGKETVYERLFADSIEHDGVITFQVDNSTSVGDFYFTIESSSNVNWEKISWKPVISYTLENGEHTTESSMNADVSFDGIYGQVYRMGDAYVVDSVGIGTFIPKLELDPMATLEDIANISGDFTITIKKSLDLIYKGDLKIEKGVITQGADSIKIPVEEGKIWVELFSDNTSMENMGAVKELTTEFISPSGSTYSLPVSIYYRWDDYRFGLLHRGWGQFSYNGMEQRAQKPIDENQLKLPESENDPNADPIKAVLIPMYLDVNTLSYWRGNNAEVYINKGVMSAARLGMQNVILENPLSNLSGGKAIAVTQHTKSKSTSVMAGGGAAGVSGTVSTANGESETLLTFLDLNGDGYPDIASKSQVQITNTTGGFDGEFIKYGTYHRSESKAKSIGVGGNPVHASSVTSAAAKVESSSKAVTKAGMEMIAKSLSNKAEAAENAYNAAVKEAASDKAALEKANTEAYIVPGGGVSDNEDEAVETFLDVNGDGLADKVLSNKQVQLNLGFGFSSAVDWGLSNIQKGENTDANISLGFNRDASSWSGGIGINTTWSKSSHAMIDVNGDGLVDKVRIDDKQAYVCLSTGNDFDKEIVWHGMTKLNRSASTGESLNASFTGGFTLPIPPVKIVFNPGVNVGHSINRPMEDFRDVDGDGFPDVVSSDREKTLTVKRSTIARTNKLKEVQNPLGGSFTLDYKRSEATYDHPGGKWVMASLEINDGVADDGANSLTHFDYADGKRDRYEREFLGFGRVITKQLDSENGNALYRTVEQTYDVANYYTAGNSLSSTLKDAEGKVYTHSTQEYYTYKVSVSGDKYSFVEASEINKLSSPMIFSPLKFTQNENHEGGSEKAILQQAHYSYRDGATGELSKYKFSDNGSLKADGSGSFNYQTSISYTDPSTAKRILALPNKVQVKGGDGKLYRETTATYDELGRITEVAQTLDNGKASANFEWDKYGNITKRTMPENASGQRMWYEYKYERDYHMYPTRIEDAWGYRSELEDYDYRYGVALRTKDMNGYYQEQEIDHMGRLKQITAPNELAEGAPYTIRFSYHKAKMSNGTLENPAYALTEHYDPEHPDNPMQTNTFVDGMGRAIQVKKDGVIANDGNKTEVSIVSGRAYFDAFGRAQKAYYPTTASLGEIEKFSPVFDDIEPTITTFDVMDRATQITMPDGTSTTNTYRVDANLQVVKTTDAQGGKQASYTNGSGLNIKTEQLSGPDGTITTSFEYDAINQLLQAIDTEGNAIVSVYDMGGRRTSVTHPDAGTSSFTYDNLGNVLTRQTANLADSSAVITYQYDYHRLTAINYPLNPENNVKYHYGTKHANHNRIGRLALQEDASGAQEFFYGRLGELTKVRRTHIIPNHAVATFETSWKYDSWNRVQEMIYPDKEKLTYHYDAGGQLEGLTGNKAYSYNYVQDVGYDKFGQRTYIKYCNGTETTYTYDPKMRRLEGLQAKNQSRTFMDNAYSFDKVGNILGVSNKATAGDVMGGQMSHTYSYDGLYRLATAEGEYAGSDNKVANYSLEMGYDNMHNITSKKQHITQTDVAFEGELLAGYELAYNYRTDKPHQLETINDNNYRTADSTAV